MQQNKLKLTIANKNTGKQAEIHFPVITPTRRKHFEALELSKDNCIITASDFHIPQVNNAILKKSANLEEINYFALLYFCEMEQNARDTFDLLVKSNYVAIENTRDILELINNHNNYYIISGASEPMHVACAYVTLAAKIGYEPDNPFSEKALEDTGRKIVKNEKGIFFEGNYIALYPSGKIKENEPLEVPEGLKLFK